MIVTYCMFGLTAVPTVAVMAEAMAPTFMSEHADTIYPLLVGSLAIIAFFLQRYLKSQDKINEQQQIINKELSALNTAMMLRLEKLCAEHESYYGSAGHCHSRQDDRER